MEFIITLPFAFAGIVVFCFMEWEKFRENIKNWWAVYFAIIVFAIIVLYQYNNCRLSENTFIAGATIIGIIYSAIYNKISLENSNKSHRETLEATNKIHRDNLEFQKRIALRKERLELIEEIKKEFQEMEDRFNFVWNDINSIRYGIVKTVTSKSGEILDDELFKYDKNSRYRSGNIATGNVTNQIPRRNNDDIKKDSFKYKLENLSFKNYNIDILLPFQERYDLFLSVLNFEDEFFNLKEEERRKKTNEIRTQKKEIEIEFNAEINKLLEQSKLE